MLRVIGRRPDGGIGFQATWRWHLALRVEGGDVVLTDDYGEVHARFPSDGGIVVPGAPGMRVTSVELTEWVGDGRVQVRAYGASRLVPVHQRDETIARLVPADGEVRLESASGRLIAAASAARGLRVMRRGETPVAKLGFFGDARA